jgi:hypothetical protein
MFENRVVKRYLPIRGRKWYGTGENCIMWSVMICTFGKILLEWLSNRIRWAGLVAHMEEKGSACMGLVGNTEEKKETSCNNLLCLADLESLCLISVFRLSTVPLAPAYAHREHRCLLWRPAYVDRKLRENLLVRGGIADSWMDVMKLIVNFFNYVWIQQQGILTEIGFIWLRTGTSCGLLQIW